MFSTISIKLLFLGLIILPITSLAQATLQVKWTNQSSLKAADVIYYSKRDRLVWDDFRAVPPIDNSRTAAITMSGFGYEAGVERSASKTFLDIQVYCYFHKGKSWVKPGKKTDYILNHEQNHFDISYIAADMFVKKIKNAKLTLQNFNVLLPSLYNECIEIMNSMQDEYDRETSNGISQVNQYKWNLLIKEKLNAATD